MKMEFLKGLITIKDIEKVIEFPNAAKDKQGRLLVGAAVGVTSDTMVRVEKLVKRKSMSSSLTRHTDIQKVY